MHTSALGTYTGYIFLMTTIMADPLVGRLVVGKGYIAVATLKYIATFFAGHKICIAPPV